MIDMLEKKFKGLFYENSDFCYFSPGRVNIIGEHIDYNGGHVLPMAISLGIYACVKFNNNSIVRCISDGFNHEQILSFDLNEKFVKDGAFTDYIKGVIAILKEKFNIDKGFDMYMYSTLPASSGLSSSAALELLTCHIMNDYYNLGLTDLECVLISQRAEREFVGVNCGIMDQFAIGMGKRDKVILLDCANIKYDYFDFNLGDSTLVIINTNKPRNLIDSKYNERRAECDEALNVLKAKYNKTALCDYSGEELASLASSLKSNLYKRALHTITEEKRVMDCIKAMANCDLVKIGKLLKESHLSLRDDYEVTGQHLDTIYNALADEDMVYGVRMTGAGFGGCAIALIKGKDKAKIDSIMEKANNLYYSKLGIKFSYYLAESSDNTRRIK